MLETKTVTRQLRSYQITLVPEDEGGYTVLVPSLPGCFSFGRTVEEAAAHAKEAIALHLQNLKAHGIGLPEETRRPVLNTVVEV
jgi:antitoxin HicB